MSTHNLCFEQKYKQKNKIFFFRKLSFFGFKMFNIFEYACFRNEKTMRKDKQLKISQYADSEFRINLHMSVVRSGTMINCFI